MPRESCQIVARVLVPEIIEEKKWICLVGIAETERTAEMNACSLECRSRFAYLILSRLDS